MKCSQGVLQGGGAGLSHPRSSGEGGHVLRPGDLRGVSQGVDRGYDAGTRGHYQGECVGTKTVALSELVVIFRRRFQHLRPSR